MRKNRSLVITTILFLICIISAHAEISFADLNLNDNDDLLFSAYQNIPGTPAYHSLLLAHLERSGIKAAPSMLTVFPERMELLNGGKILQVRNRYGSAWYNTATRNISWISSANRIPVEYTHMGPQEVSPDGNWICYVRKIKSSQGQLVIQNVQTFEEKVLSESVAFSYDSVGVKWAPDSSAVLYEKNGIVYFFTPSALLKKIQLPDSYCKIGEGSINSVAWTDEKKLVYIDGDIIYSIQENELYTRGLYSALIGSGKIIGRLPSSFDAYKDSFWCDGDGRQIVVLTSDRVVSYFTLPAKGFDFVQSKGMYPLTSMDGSILEYNVFWTNESKPILWIDMLRFDTGRKASSVYALNGKMELVLTVKGSIRPALSPDKRHVAFTGGTSLYVYDTTTWKQTAHTTGEKVISFVWNEKRSLYIGGTQTVRLWSFNAAASTAASLENDTTPASLGVSNVIFISSVSTAYWNGNEIIAFPSESSTAYSYDAARNGWNLMNTVPKNNNKNPELNGKYRVFTDAARNKLYKNAIYVRSLGNNVVTFSLYADTDVVVDEPKKAAVVFDAMDSVDGLSRILFVLDEYNIKGTFFINGEFIRRYPAELKQIIAAGHECASGFYTCADLTNKDFVIDEDFIKRGLARNEDEFFTATGKELSLLWHAPYYHDTPLMKAAGKSAGYRYVDAYTGYSDRVTVEQSERDPSYLYLDAGKLIDAYTSSLEENMIIPVTVGKVHGTRKDYLYEKIDLLIAAILDKGYALVDVRTLTE